MLLVRCRQGRVVLDAWRFPAWTSLRERKQGSLGAEAGRCSSPIYVLVSAEVRFGSVSRVPWVPMRGVAPPQCTAWFPKREPIGDEEHTAAEPLGKARGTQAEPT